jgi:hypothetical protein
MGKQWQKILATYKVKKSVMQEVLFKTVTEF